MKRLFSCLAMVFLMGGCATGLSTGDVGEIEAEEVEEVNADVEEFGEIASGDVETPGSRPLTPNSGVLRPCRGSGCTCPMRRLRRSRGFGACCAGPCQIDG